MIVGCRLFGSELPLLVTQPTAITPPPIPEFATIALRVSEVRGA